MKQLFILVRYQQILMLVKYPYLLIKIINTQDDLQFGIAQVQWVKFLHLYRILKY